jgi:hypothetical protein
MTFWPYNVEELLSIEQFFGCNLIKIKLKFIKLFEHIIGIVGKPLTQKKMTIFDWSLQLILNYKRHLWLKSH